MYNLYRTDSVFEPIDQRRWMVTFLHKSTVWLDGGILSDPSKGTTIRDYILKVLVISRREESDRVSNSVSFKHFL